MTRDALYDRIGRTYARTRQPDPRIAAQIHRALGGATSVLNVGAGAGSYEPTDRSVVALERSLEMIRQRPNDAAPAVQGDATALPFADDSFDAATAILTVHHWPDREAGLRELRRVVRSRIVILTHETAKLADFWLTRDYFPQVAPLDEGRFLTSGETAALLGDVTVEPVPVPADCVDGFLAAFWTRPEAYFDPEVRAGISFFPMVSDDVIEDGLARLRADLDSGRWHERNGHLLSASEMDWGYRLLVATP